MSFFRVFQHLLPSGEAWRLHAGKALTRFISALAAAPTDARAFIDGVLDDLWPTTTRELEEWERQFGLPSTGSQATRRLQLAAAWQSFGGPSPAYIQNVLHAAGFTQLFVHESFPTPNGPTFVPRDPRLYTQQPLIGTVQCTPDGMMTQPQCSAYVTQPQCNAFLTNEPGYLVNKDLTDSAPPPIPDHQETWPFFLYVGAATFPDVATVALSRRAELERLLLSIRQTHHWIVMLVEYSSVGVFDPSFDETFG